jgi:hypothetical protein
MGFLLLAILVLFVLEAALSIKKTRNTVQAQIVPTCPPHKWRHYEIKNKKNETVGWKLVCERCGPLNVE